MQAHSHATLGSSPVGEISVCRGGPSTAGTRSSEPLDQQVAHRDGPVLIERDHARAGTAVQVLPFSARWHKSSDQGGQCVEIADFDGGARAVRDSKDPKDPAGLALMFTAAEWVAFTTRVRVGEFD
ncbi:MAG TPA: DUF397 domain-containing protein [Pseudonocardiaceae bacterium]|nr:DUF397 domain-containing protein [Pseudonocardiaceae bacterium]